MKRIIITTAFALWTLLCPAFVCAQTIIWVSPTGTGIGTSGDPMSLSALNTALASGGALFYTTNLEVRFYNGTYDIPAGSATVSVLVFPAAAVNIKLTSADPAYKPIISAPSTGNTTSTRRARFCNMAIRTAPTTIEINNLEFRYFYAPGTTSIVDGSLFAMGLATENPNTSMVLDSLIIDNCSNYGTDRDYLIGFTASATSNKNLTLTNSIIRNTSNRGRPIEIRAASTNSKLIIHDNVFENCAAGSYLISLYSGTSTIYNNTFRNCTLSTAVGYHIVHSAGSARVDFYDNTIYGNSSNRIINLSSGTGNIYNNRIYSNTSTAYILNFYGGAQANVYNNSIYNNPLISISVVGTADAATKLTFYKNSVYNNPAIANFLMNLATPADIYNNTFSGNTLTNTTANNRSININNAATSSIKLVNNTIYNSGSLRFNTNRAVTRIVNNIVVTNTTANAILGTNTAVLFRTNVFNEGANILFRPMKSNDGTNNVTASFNTYFNPVLNVSDPAPGRQLHTLNDDTFDDGLPWNIHSGTTVASFIPFDDDQRGVKRPDPVAIGSYDGSYFKLRPGMPAYIRYTTAPEPYTPTSGEIDLARFLEQKIVDEPITYELLSPTAPNPAVGTITDPPSDGKVTFNLHPTTPAEGRVKYIYRVTQGTHTGIDSFEVVVVDATNLQGMADDLPGFVDSKTIGSCYDYMGAVNFTSAYRFQGHVVNGDGTGTRMYGYSIPLVADLNHDGDPEVLGVSTYATTDAAIQRGDYHGINIYSGQTGKRLVRLPFTGVGTAGYYTEGYHATPSIMALVDSDRDGTVEVVVAFPNSVTGSGTMRNKVASFDIEYNPGNPTVPYTLVHRWTSAADYNTPLTSANKAYMDRPIVHIADLDMDGDAEVVVYNKVYRARNGDLLATMETLAYTETTSSAYVGRQSTSGDFGHNSYVGFSYIYDMDGDGAYDVVAGGKVYYKFDFSQPEGSKYKTVQMTGVLDGRTGVADINGDGLPDVVTARRTSSGNIDLKIWNPDLVRLDGSGKLATNTGTAVPVLLASRALTFAWRDGNGTNSYVYIGDIDGREQVVDGKIYRLPEVAILSGQLNYLSEATNAGGSHPNVLGSDVLVKIPTTGNSGTSSQNTGDNGVLAAWTWDARTGVTDAQRMKLSFVLGHTDASVNTGFTMFDFDNDGVQEICYRDEERLRILKAVKPYVTMSETRETTPEVILFRESVLSGTGFEYPVIADIDNDASAEIVVMGRAPSEDYGTYGWLYALGNGSGDKFAPALPVWNQFMYDPFKINPDLTVPLGGVPAPNRLDPAYNMVREIKDENNIVIKVIENVNPYNGTLIQAPKIDGTVLPKFDPIVFLPQAFIRPSNYSVIAERPEIVQVGANSYIALTIGNHAGALSSVSVNTPVAVYSQNTLSHGTRDTTWTLGDLLIAGSTTDSLKARTVAIAPDSAFRLWIPILDPEGVYIIRLGDNSDGAGWHFGYNKILSNADFCPDDGFSNANNTGLSTRAFRDCNWCDQTVRAAKFNVFPDFYTVQEFKSIEMDILGNDILPDVPAVNDNYYLTNLMLTDTHIETPPKAGYLTFNGISGVNSRMTYHHADSVPLTAGIDSFRYALRFWNPQEAAYVTKSTWVYIYVLESATYGFSACYGEWAHIEIRNLPEGVSFDWYATQTSSDLIETGLSHNTAAMQGDSTYWLKPVMLVENEHYQAFDFPRGELTVALATWSSNATATMQWTGLFSTNWRDVRNWVEVKTEGGSTYTTPVLWPPTTCVDVIIPSGADYYPELLDAVACRNISLKDRAMLKNPHVLVYDSARVELKMKPSERDRFVMWSAPLMNTYSGDYHFKTDAAVPRWGDVYMNYFQQAHPSGGTAAPLVFTSTFGELNAHLGLGKAFNLKVTSTTVTREQQLVFPQTSTSYTADNAAVYTTVRTVDAGKFITEGQVMEEDTTFALPVAGPNTGFNLIQVVNPYLAYLSFAQFRAGNTSNITNGYYIWNGDLNAGFTVVSSTGNRYRMTTEPSLSASPDLIPPLQSFLVKKSDPTAANVTSLWMSPNWTTTSTPATSYLLRSAPVASDANTLRIKASQGAKTSYVILVYDQNASPDLGREDMPVLVYDEIPLTLYSYTALHEPLAIHASSDFRSVDLGLRVRDAGETKLEFTGLSSFGHDVYLIDREKDNLEINLQQQPEYTFVVTKAASGVVELNSRFSLRMEYTGNGLTDIQPLFATELVVTALDGTIHIHSLSGSRIRDLQVYNMGGGLIYSSRTEADSFHLPVTRGEVYVIRAQTNNQTTHEVRKVWVK